MAALKPLPMENREKVVKAYEQGNTSIRKLVARFDVSKYECLTAAKTQTNYRRHSTLTSRWKSEK